MLESILLFLMMYVVAAVFVLGVSSVLVILVGFTILEALLACLTTAVVTFILGAIRRW